MSRVSATTNPIPSEFYGTLTLGYEIGTAPTLTAWVKSGRVVWEKPVTNTLGTLTITLDEADSPHILYVMGAELVEIEIKDADTLQPVTIQDKNASEANHLWLPISYACKAESAGTLELVHVEELKQYQACC